MKVVLATDAVRPPLTGIGRYVLELARRLPTVPGVQNVCYLSGQRVFHSIDEQLGSPGIPAAVRERLAGNRLAVLAYRVVSPIQKYAALRKYPDHIFHGPNFYLPPFNGRRVVTIHDLSVFKWAHCHPVERVRFMQKEIPLALKRADVVVTVSEFIRREVMEFFGLSRKRVVVIPLAAAAEFVPRTHDESHPVLSDHGLRYGGYTLFVGTIEPRKNLSGLLDAYSILPREVRQGYPLVVVGDRGWRSEALHDRLMSAQREGWAAYLGYVAEADLPVIFSSARAFAFPSLYEGFGLPVLEAMASGVPVVCSNSASLPEVAGNAAAICSAEDVDALSRLLLRAIEDEEWRQDAIAAGLAHARTFSWDRMALLTVEAYRIAERAA